MNSINNLLRIHDEFINSYVNHICSFINNKQILEICNDYSASIKSTHSIGFNVFTLTSDIYYRENYHSDIIKAFLNPKGNHNQGTVFLSVLINMLNDSFGNRLKINEKYYFDAEAKREEGKLDILVLSQANKHCIIIENKINNAGDMPRQLPRYYDYMVSKGFDVDAIIYIPLCQSKYPDTSDWSQEDKNHVFPIYYHLPAYTKDGTPNLVDNWILPCSALTNDIDCHSILRQYGRLIKSLNHEIMDKTVTSKFYNILLNGDNYDTALSLKAMLEDIPVLMADRLYELLLSNKKIGEDVWNGHKPNFCGVIFRSRDIRYKIDTYSSIEGYTISLFPIDTDRTQPIPWLNFVESAKNGCRQENGEYYFKFPFRAEKEVVSFIRELLDAAETYDIGSNDNIQ